MATTIAKIILGWNQVGRLYHDIPSSKPKSYLLPNILGPSAPLLISHQLGTMQPSYGLLLCESALRYLAHGEFMNSPINSVLKGLEIRVLQLQNNRVTINVHPKHKLFSNQDSLEEGVRQLTTNYLPYVMGQISNFPHAIIGVKFFTAAIIGIYHRTLEGLIEKRMLGRNQWSIAIPQTMANVTSETARDIPIEFHSESDAKDTLQKFENILEDDLERQKKLSYQLKLR